MTAASPAGTIPQAAEGEKVRVVGGIMHPPAAPLSVRAGRPHADRRALDATALRGLERLRAGDPVLYELVAGEHRRQGETLTMAAASGIADPAVLACEGTSLLNTTAEGEPGARSHAVRELADRVERLAVERAREAFGARYASVRPHSGASADQLVMSILLRPGDTVLGPDPDAAGHLSHGALTPAPGVHVHAVAYGAGADGRIGMDQVRRLALEHRPRLIVCGAPAYPRTIDFAAFRRVADEAGAFLLADISHLAGLVAGGEHPSPIDHAHFTTIRTCTQLCGPRGGLVLMGRDHDAPAPGGRETLSDTVRCAALSCFPGTPDLAALAASCAALARAATPGFRESARRSVATAKALAGALAARGYTVVSGGTDNHLVVVDLAPGGLTGAMAQRALEACGIVADTSPVPGGGGSARSAGGVCFGTSGLALRGMGAAEMATCAELVDRVLSGVRPIGGGELELSPAVAARARDEVAALCARFPIPGYGASPAPGVIPIGVPARRATTPVDPFSLPAEGAA